MRAKFRKNLDTFYNGILKKTYIRLWFSFGLILLCATGCNNSCLDVFMILIAIAVYFNEQVVGACINKVVTNTSEISFFIMSGSQRAKRKVVRMLVIVVIIFAVCCLPFHALFLYMDYFGEVHNLSLIHFVQWLFYANSACNPIVYAVFNTNYRREFINILRCR